VLQWPFSYLQKQGILLCNFWELYFAIPGNSSLQQTVQCKVFHRTLTYQPEACYACGHVFDEQIIKHSFKNSLIEIPSVSGFHAYLKLRKQRYLC
jgi:transposase